MDESTPPARAGGAGAMPPPANDSADPTSAGEAGAVPPAPEAAGPGGPGALTPEPALVPTEDRLAVRSAALLFAIVPVVLGLFTLAAAHPPSTVVVIAVAGAALATAAAIALAGRLAHLTLEVLFAADAWAVALIAVVVAFSGHYHSHYVQLYLLPVVHAAAFQSRRRVLALVVGALAGYLVPAAAAHGIDAASVADASIPLLTVVLAAGVVHAAAARLRAQRDAWAQREADARRLADQDPLTGLGNYRLFWRAAEAEAARVQRHGGSFSLVLLDLDRFKAVNDDLGHRVGDAVLQRVAHGLLSALRREDVLCRHGGDEFAVVAVQTGPEEAEQLAERLIDAVAGAGEIDRHSVTATAGWATFGVHAETLEDLVLRADDALRGAKRAERRSALARAVGAAEADSPATVSGSAAGGALVPAVGAGGQDEAQRLAFLAGLSRALAATRDERTAVETAVAHLAGAMDAVVVGAARLVRERRTLEVIAYAGSRALAPPPAQPAGAGILGAAAANERPVLVGDVRADPRYVGLPELSDVRSELAVPVFDRGEVWGVLNLESDRVDAYTPADVHLLQAVSVQLGRALAWVWGFARLAERTVDGAYEIAAAVQEPGDQCWRLADLAWRLGRELGLGDSELEALYLGALFHDVGTVGVPTGVLVKPGRLTRQELALVREHPVIGERILRPLPRLRRAASLIRHEHERYDGRGYPDGLAGEAIPLASRALLACDAYVAMTSARTFRPALAPQVARDELRRAAGSQLDPRVVAALLRLLEREETGRAAAAG